MPAQLTVFIRQQHEPPQHAAGQEHEDQCWENAPNSASVEAAEAEIADPQAAQDDAGDQETGNNEKNIDADEAAGRSVREGMVGDDQEDRDGAKAVDIAAVAGMRLRRLCPRRRRPEGALLLWNGHSSGRGMSHTMNRLRAEQLKPRHPAAICGGKSLLVMRSRALPGAACQQRHIRRRLKH
jgi:hypothetical protein